MTEWIRVVQCKDCIFHRKPSCAMSYTEVSEYSGYPENTTIFLLTRNTDYCPHGIDKQTGRKAEGGIENESFR